MASIAPRKTARDVARMRTRDLLPQPRRFTSLPAKRFNSYFLQNSGVRHLWRLSHMKVIKRLVPVGICAALLSAAIATATANPSPNGPGQPGAPQTACGDANA